MGRNDLIEFYLRATGQLLLVVESSHAPDRGDLVNFRKTTYQVVGRSYTIDHADEARERQVVCVINLDPAPE